MLSFFPYIMKLFGFQFKMIFVKGGLVGIKWWLSAVMSHCTTHSFEIICRGWKVGLADHMMHSFYK